MKIPVPIEAVVEPGFAVVTFGDKTLRLESDGESVRLYPDRHYKHRLYAKYLGLVTD